MKIVRINKFSHLGILALSYTSKGFRMKVRTAQYEIRDLGYIIRLKNKKLFFYEK